MSADNGVYLLKTPKDKDDTNSFEFRVRHAQAIENIFWHPDINDYSEDANPEILMGYFEKCEVLTEEDARQKAFEMEQEILNDDFCPILEYGIRTIELEHSFEWYRKRAGEKGEK